MICCGVVPKGLLTFLGVLGNAEFSPWKRLPGFIENSGSHKKVCGCFRDSQWRHGFLGVYRLCRVPKIKSYILSWGHSVFGRKKNKILAVCLSKRYIKVPEVVFAPSL